MQKWIEEWDEAVRNEDEERQLMAAGAIVDVLKESPLAVVFGVGPAGSLRNVLAHVHVRGRQVELIQGLKMALDASTDQSDVEATLPEVGPSVVESLGGRPVAEIVEESADILGSAGIRVVRAPSP